MENDRSTMKNMEGEQAPNNRENMLDVVEELIYTRGIAATGIDLITRTTGSSRKTIYRYFGTKEGLIEEVLRRRDERWMRWFTSSIVEYKTPKEKLLNIFLVLQRWFVSDDFRGCAFINTSGERPNPDDPVRIIAKEHKEKVFTYVLSICEEISPDSSADLARKLLLLIEGAITTAHVMNDTHYALEAMNIAEALLNKYDVS
ncbi:MULTISPECIES: TetR/AcrR family transcriptional regulator [Photorhabdus]|uniref:TetR/AcrR family transcriptional regulator n=1 Tax=Photorhabdus TaxID=29487 RepID=UPI000DCB8A7A|nr:MULTISPECIES: TetR/AcrR family transcriptional regulator [Photorhabdus]MCT8341652.1 TetR/AcrR family transcriptional regulator [Photorhabdus kleinii]RAW94156.1 TetR family transcriptional regulator [Photorhabdus sp. S9-53]RAW94301.1 TetR family transcriptional regulator [Photorhabdus sp. S10-54]RAW97931.1 TetR family transcriptional regulator [Photorhabdus sp. S8-52]